MNTRDEIIHEALKRFVDYNNKFHAENNDPPPWEMDADDKNYFFTPRVISDTRGPGLFERTLVVYQGLNDELNSIGFVIVCAEDYSSIDFIVLEVDTAYQELK